jgi:hypothetical protein
MRHGDQNDVRHRHLGVVPVTRLDGGLWATGPTGALGPTGFLGQAKWDEANLFYAPLHDYHLDPPDISPEVAARCRLVQGRANILAQTTIAQQTSVLSGTTARLVEDADWFALVGDVAATAATEDVITLHRRSYEDHRVGVFEFWWASPEGREDQELVQALFFLANHELATRGYLGVLTSTDDAAVVEQYSNQQQVVTSPWDRLVELNRTDMVQA